MLLNSHISAYPRWLAGRVCGLVRSTWGTSQGEDKLGARGRILKTKVARRANIPPRQQVTLASIKLLISWVLYVLLCPWSTTCDM